MAAAVEVRRPRLDELLPTVDPAVSAAVNTWLDARGPSVFQLDSTEFRLTWVDPSSVQPQFGLEIVFGTHGFLLALDGFAAVNPLLVGDPFAMLPAALRDLVAQRLLARFMALLPPSLTESADVRATHWLKEGLPNWASRLGFRLERLPSETPSYGVIAAQSPAGLLWIHQKLITAQPSTPAARLALSVPVRIGLGRTTLEPTQLRSLDAGDVVWIDSAHLKRDGLEAALIAPGGRTVWYCRAQHATLRVVPSPDEQAADVASSAPEIAASGNSGENMNAGITSLEIPVTFDMGDLSVPVHELEGLQPGRVFELPQDVANATVNLRVSGRLIAEGKLVVIGKRVGVRISHIRVRRESEGEYAFTPTQP